MGEAKRRLALGATGTFSDGVSRRPGDMGDLRLAISDPDSDGIIHVDFGCDVSCLGLRRDDAINLARMLLRKAGVKKVEITL